MTCRARLSALLLALACGQGVLAQDAAPTPTTLTVGVGDTAAVLAQKLRPEGATLEQTLVALWRANPRAFANGNLNQLLQGASIQVPSERDILSLSAAQAHAMVAEQVDNIQAFVRQQKRSASDTVAASTGVDATQWARALAEAQALKGALERQNQNNQLRLAQLEKNIAALQAMQAASSASPTTSKAADAASETVTGASTPQAEASAPPEPARQTAATAASSPADFSQPLLWTGAALALLLLGLAIRQRSRSSASAATVHIQIPPQMASIDLNLDSPPPGAAGKQEPHL